MRKINEKRKKGAIYLSSCILFTLFLLVSCGGARLVEEPEIIQIPQPLAMSTDDTITGSLYWVVVRNGLGSWVENADWDEYLINVTNRSNAKVQIDSVIVVDSLGTRLSNSDKLKKLLKGSKKTAKRYKDRNVKMKSGYRPSTLYGTAAAGGAAAGATIAGTSGMMAAGTAMAVVATIVAIPVLVGAGVYRGVVNEEISDEIQRRSTSLPVKVSTGESHSLDLFFPLAPSPTTVEIHYTSNEVQHSLIIDTTDSLDSLHLPPPRPPLKIQDVNEEDVSEDY